MRRVFSLIVFILSLFILLQIGSEILANNRPIVTKVIASVSANGIKLKYDVYDKEFEPMAVYIKISSDSGRTYSIVPDSIFGQIGYPVYNGTGKEIMITMALLSNVYYRITVIADDRNSVGLAELANQVDSVRIKNDLYMMEGPRQWQTSYQHLQNMKDSIQNRFAGKNLANWRNYFNYSSYTGANIIGRQVGILNDSNTYILGGHFDTVPITPGADDNATGPVGMIEVMRVLSQYAFNYSINYIGFDLEEAPGLYGSWQYVLTGIPSYQRTQGMINLEMIGYYCDIPNCQTVPSTFCTQFPSVCDSLIARQYRGDFIFNVANINSESIKSIYDSCAKVIVPDFSVLSFAVPGNGGTLSDVRRSDHARFWDAGYKAIMLSNLYNYRNPYYHTFKDTVGTLNIGRMTKVIKAVTASIAKLAGIKHSGFGFSNYVTTNIITIKSNNNNGPEKFVLFQNYPNPFNPTTKINFSIPLANGIGEGLGVRLTIFDILGREVATLVNEQLKPGTYEVEYDGSKLSSGVYFYKLVTGDFTETRKMVIIK